MKIHQKSKSATTMKNKQGEEVYLRCPTRNHLIEDLDEGEFSPCEHSVAVWIDVASGWEVIEDDLRDKWVEDDGRMYSGEEEDWPYEWDADDPEEWGKRNIPCDRIIEINGHMMDFGSMHADLDDVDLDGEIEFYRRD